MKVYHPEQFVYLLQTVRNASGEIVLTAFPCELLSCVCLVTVLHGSPHLFLSRSAVKVHKWMMPLNFRSALPSWNQAIWRSSRKHPQNLAWSRGWGLNYEAARECDQGKSAKSHTQQFSDGTQPCKTGAGRSCNFTLHVKQQKKAPEQVLEIIWFSGEAQASDVQSSIISAAWIQQWRSAVWVIHPLPCSHVRGN